MSSPQSNTESPSVWGKKEKEKKRRRHETWEQNPKSGFFGCNSSDIDSPPAALARANAPNRSVLELFSYVLLSTTQIWYSFGTGSSITRSLLKHSIPKSSRVTRYTHTREINEFYILRPCLPISIMEGCRHWQPRLGRFRGGVHSSAALQRLHGSCSARRAKDISFSSAEFAFHIYFFLLLTCSWMACYWA